MAATNAQIANSARDALYAILNGQAAEWANASDSARALEIDRLEKIINNFEGLDALANVQVFRPIRSGRGL